MTISKDEALISGPYAGNGVTTSYDYDFKIYADTELTVLRQNADGTVSTLALATDYSVTGVADAGGGQVVLSAGSVLPTGATLTIEPNITPSQDRPFSTQSSITLVQIELALDKLTSFARQLLGVSGRALNVSAARIAGGFDVDLANVSPGQFLRVRDDDSGLVGADLTLDVSASDAVFAERLALNASAAASLADGKIAVIAGLSYLVDSTATGTASATYDLGVDGLRPSGVIDTRHFGIVGVGDEVSKFQRWAASASVGSRLNIAPGSYSVSDSVSVAAQGVTVTAHGATITQTGLNKKTLNFTDPVSCKVIGGSFVGRGTEHNGASSSYNGVAAIYFDGPQDCLVEGVKITNHAGGSIAFKDADGLTVRNSVIVGIGAAGGISPLDNNADFAVGAFGGTAENNITVENCRIRDTCFGIGASRGAGLIVRGNIFENTPGQHHIYASAMSDMIVSGNYFGPCEGEAVKNQITASSDIDTDNVVICDNIFENIGQSCVAIGWAAGATVGRHKGVLVADNVARGIGNYFAVIRRCDRGDVVGNVFEEIGATGLDLQDWRGRVVGNTVRDDDWYAIYATVNGDCEFSGNIIEDAALNASGAATDFRYQVMAYITAFSGSGHRVEWRDNVLKMGSAPTHLAYALRSSSSVNIALDGGANLSGYPHYIQGMVHNDGQHSPSVDNVITSTLNPTTPIYGRGKRHLYGTQDPASASMTDTFRQGDVCWNTTPSAGGTVGWVCTSSGAPGTWKAFGTIAT